MSVGQDKAPDTVGVCLQVADVRQNNVNAVHILIGKAHTAVDHDNVAAELVGSHIFADLTQTAQGNNFQFRYHISSISVKLHAKSQPRHAAAARFAYVHF